MHLQWSEWNTTVKLPFSMCRTGDYIGYIEQCAADEDSAYRNRRWEVMHKGLHLAGGFTYGTADAEKLVEVVMAQAGAFSAPT